MITFGSNVASSLESRTNVTNDGGMRAVVFTQHGNYI